MPIVPSGAYVTVETVTLLLRALANDMIYSQAGEILTDTANFLFPLLNDTLEWFTAECINHGVETFTKETYILAVPIVGVNDPGVQVNLNDSGFYNGVAASLLPILPADLYLPDYIWERQNGSTENWVPMRECLGGMPSVNQGDRLGIWEWRQDAIYMPGAIQVNDLRLRYQGNQASFVSVNDTLYFRGGVGPIAYKTLSSYLISKNPEAATQAASEANMRMSQIFTRSSRMKQRSPSNRKSYGNLSGGYGFFPPRNP